MPHAWRLVRYIRPYALQLLAAVVLLALVVGQKIVAIEQADVLRRGLADQAIEQNQRRIWIGSLSQQRR